MIQHVDGSYYRYRRDFAEELRSRGMCEIVGEERKKPTPVEQEIEDDEIPF
jgi:hypothetical protein